MRASITGATGLLGGNLAIELLNQGWEVVATKRRSSKTSHLEAFDIEWIDAGLDDPESLHRAFDGADVVFHCAAAVSIQYKVEPWIYEANVVGTNNVISAVLDHATKLVHCSTVGAVGLSPDGTPSTEEREWNMAQYGLDDAYVKTKHEAELNVRKAVVDSGLQAVIVNPTYMIGPHDVKPSSGAMVLEVVKGRMPGYTLGVNNFVDVRDVARGMVLAAERGKVGDRYILGGTDMTYKEFVELVARAAGVKPPSMRLPRLLAKAVGLMGDLQGKLTGGEPLLNSATVEWALTDRYRFTSAKAERELGYEISELEPAIEACLAWFRENGML